MFTINISPHPCDKTLSFLHLPLHPGFILCPTPMGHQPPRTLPLLGSPGSSLTLSFPHLLLSHHGPPTRRHLSWEWMHTPSVLSVPSVPWHRAFDHLWAPLHPLLHPLVISLFDAYLPPSIIRLAQKELDSMHAFIPRTRCDLMQSGNPINVV